MRYMYILLFTNHFSSLYICSNAVARRDSIWNSVEKCYLWADFQMSLNKYLMVLLLSRWEASYLIYIIEMYHNFSVDGVDT